MSYYIRNLDGDYWSNELGWTEFPALADRFPTPDLYQLPIGGHWEAADRELTEAGR